jgi:acyl-homoserine lactone acylase PvdQ
MGIVKDFCLAVVISTVAMLLLFLYLVKPVAVPEVEIIKFEDGEITIKQDLETGIPQVYASDKFYAYYGLGYVHARDRLHQMKVS